jgi:hypothetical protein
MTWSTLKIGEMEIPDLASAGNIPAQIAIVRRGSPKLRALLRMISDTVALFDGKLIVRVLYQ